MANYKPKIKGIIARDTLIPPRGKLDPVDVFIFVMCALVIAFFLLFYIISSQPILLVFLGLVVAFLIGYILIMYVIPPIVARKKAPPKYYLELDTVSSVVITTDIRRRYSYRTKMYRDVTYYDHTVSFKSQRSITYTYSEYDTPVNKYPTMKNNDDIPRHMVTIKELQEGDICYLKLCEGDNDIIEIFDSKYYAPSPTDFEEFGDRYYLTEIGDH